MIDVLGQCNSIDRFSVRNEAPNIYRHDFSLTPIAMPFDMDFASVKLPSKFVCVLHFKFYV